MTRVSQGNLPEMNHSSRHFFLFRLSRGCVGSIGSVRRWFRRRPLLRVAKRFIGHAGPIVSRGRGDAKPFVECARKLQRTSEQHAAPNSVQRRPANAARRRQRSTVHRPFSTASSTSPPAERAGRTARATPSPGRAGRTPSTLATDAWCGSSRTVSIRRWSRIRSGCISSAGHTSTPSSPPRSTAPTSRSTSRAGGSREAVGLDGDRRRHPFRDCGGVRDHRAAEAREDAVLRARGDARVLAEARRGDDPAPASASAPPDRRDPRRERPTGGDARP